MRRKDKEITDYSEIEAIIQRAQVCHLALFDKDFPYVIPLNFGYQDGCLYFHSAKEGKKIELLRKNNRVSFEFDIDLAIEMTDKACNWTTKYRSVIGYGRAKIIDETAAKREALNILVKHYSGKTFNYFPEAIADTLIIQVTIESMSGKKSGFEETTEDELKSWQ